MIIPKQKYKKYLFGEGNLLVYARICVKIYRAVIFLLLSTKYVRDSVHVSLLNIIMVSLQRGPTVNLPILIDSRLKE